MQDGMSRKEWAGQIGKSEPHFDFAELFDVET